MINLIKPQTKQDYKNIKKLYKKTFPKKERKPFKFILSLQEKGFCNIYIITDEDNLFFGFLTTLNKDNTLILDYLAIDSNYRGKNIGTKTLQALSNIYANKCIFIEIEDTTSSNAKNIICRLKRKNFYAKNGFVGPLFKVKQNGVDLEVLSNNNDAKFEDYFAVLQLVYNNKASKNTQLLF